MKKWFVIALGAYPALRKTAAGISFILLSCMVIGCSPHVVPSVPASENNEPPASVSEQSGQASNSEPAYDADDIFKDASPVNFRKDSPFNHEQIENELLNIAGLCSDIYAAMKREYGYFFPTETDREAIVDRIAGEGHIATSVELNMRNAEVLKEVYNKIQSGQQSEFCVYYVDDMAQISRTSFLYKDGVIYYTNPYIYFDADGEPVYNDTDLVRALDTFFMSDKGYLIYGANGAGFAGFGAGYRVEPLSVECREMKKKYLEPLQDYLGHNIFVENWNQDNMKQIINFNDVFDILYMSDTGMRPHDVFTDSFTNYPQAMAAPSQEFERVITKYFPITAEELRDIAVYDEINDVYAWPFLKGAAYSQDFEVVDYKYNSDGSLTVIFDALNLHHGDDRNATNTLTVMPKSDGSFQYISNVIEYNPEKEPWNLTYHPTIKFKKK